MDDVETFLKESNAIEHVYDDESLADAKDAWKFLMSQDVLSLSVVRETHKLLMRNKNLEPKYIGDFRDCPVYVGNRMCPPAYVVAPLMWEWTLSSMRTYPTVDAKYLHVRFEKIHPFIDGNGRTGRMFMNWTRLKRTNEPLLIIKESEKEKYYEWFH